MTNQSVIMGPTVPDAKKLRILDAARRLLIRRGFQDIVLDDVAREAGVAKGTLFLHYRSKEEMFSAAFADLVDQLGAALEGVLVSGKRGRSLLTEMVRTILEHFDRNRDFMSQFGAGRFPGCGTRSSARLMERLGENLARVIRVLRLCARDGLFGPRDLESRAAFLFGLCRSGVMQKHITGHDRPLAASTRKVVDFFLDGAREAR